MNTLSSTTAFTDTEAPPAIERPFRPSAVLALLLGIISISVAASIQLLVLPLLAIGVGAFALRPAADPEIRPVGRSLAVGGIVLALLFASWALTAHWIRSTNLSERAAIFARDYMAILAQGRSEFAFELAQPAERRQLGSMALTKYYDPANEQAYEQYDSFLSAGATQEVIDAGPQAQWVVQSVPRTYAMYGSDYVEVRLVDRSGTISRPVAVTMVRTPEITDEGTLDDTAPHQWHVHGVEFAD